MKEISIGEFARRSRLSLKALRLYDERGVLVPARVDQASGYRYYDTAQLEDARLVVMLRELQLPLAAVKELLACDPADAAARIAEHWRDAEAAHDARCELAGYLVSRLSGTRPVMYEVATREMPGRSLLCLKRTVDEQGQWAFGKEFIAILRERRLPRIEGRAGAFFCIYWGLVSGDSDGPVEWCRPVPQAEARALAERYPDLTLRTEPAHHLSRDRVRHRHERPRRLLRPRPPVRSRAMIEAHGLVKRYGSAAVESSAWDIGAPLDEGGTGLADELGSSPGPAGREDTRTS